MAAQLVFSTHPVSRRRSVRWMREEIGTAHETEMLVCGTIMKAEACRAIKPLRTFEATVAH